MKRLLSLLLLITVSATAFAQGQFTIRSNNTAKWWSEEYVPNSPTSSTNNRTYAFAWADTTWYIHNTQHFVVKYLKLGTDEGAPNSFLWANDTGRVMRSPISRLATAIAGTGTFATVATSGSYTDLTNKPTIPGGTVTSVTPANSSLTVTNATTAPVITVNDAPRLTTARSINGVSFDGTSNITIPGSAITSIPNASLSNSSITINGNNVALGGSTTVAASPSVGAPSSSTAITMGTAFQPRSGGPCFIAVSGTLSGILGLNETITISMSATSGGTYTTVATDQLLLGLAGLSLDRCVGTFPVPAGWWVRVTRSGTAASATYTKWDL